MTWVALSLPIGSKSAGVEPMTGVVKTVISNDGGKSIWSAGQTAKGGLLHGFADNTDEWRLPNG